MASSFLWRRIYGRLASPLSSHVSEFGRSAYPRRSISIFSIFNKKAIEKERTRLKDEVNRGYFDDLKDLKKHMGKVFAANSTLIPADSATTFPNILVYSPSLESFVLPVGSSTNGEVAEMASATLICIGFRANAQPMVESWMSPFADAFSSAPDVKIYEVSWIESSFLSLGPMRNMLLRRMRRDDKINELHKQVVYAFGDSYDACKALNITNRLSGYAFLIDESSQIRWRGSGMANSDEISSLVSCTTDLLDLHSEAINEEIKIEI